MLFPCLKDFLFIRTILPAPMNQIKMRTQIREVSFGSKAQAIFHLFEPERAMRIKRNDGPGIFCLFHIGHRVLQCGFISLGIRRFVFFAA